MWYFNKLSIVKKDLVNLPLYKTAGEIVKTLDGKKIIESDQKVIFNAINLPSENHFEKTIYVGNIAHSVSELIIRQYELYSYHIGQIVFISKMIFCKTGLLYKT